MQRRGFADRLLGAGAFFVFIFIATVLGGSLFKFLGMEYRSFWDVFLFFTWYFILDIMFGSLLQILLISSLSRKKALIVNALANLAVSCLLMMLLDRFMDSLSVPFRAEFVFAAVFCLFDLIGGWRRTAPPLRAYLFEKKPEVTAESRELLMEVLAMYCADFGLDFERENARIEEGAHGKPALARRKNGEWISRDDIYFSVSHTRNWWLCVVYNKPIGVDMEERDRLTSLSAEDRIFTDEERDWLSRMGATTDHLLDLWVRKEAYVKYLGTGISEGLRSFSTVRGGELAPYVGENEKRAFCAFLFPDHMLDMEGYPVPLTGAFCTEDMPEGMQAADGL